MKIEKNRIRKILFLVVTSFSAILMSTKDCQAEPNPKFSYSYQMKSSGGQFANWSAVGDTAKDAKILFLTGVAQQLDALLLLPRDVDSMKAMFSHREFASDRELQNLVSSSDRIIRQILNEIRDAFGDPIYVFSDADKTKAIEDMFERVVELTK